MDLRDPDSLDDDFDPHEFDGGQLGFCATASDAILLEAFERAAGHRTAIFFDWSYCEMVVATTRPWSIRGDLPITPVGWPGASVSGD